METSRYDWYNGTYGIGTFEASWWEGAEYESVHHANEGIAAPALGYTIRGATHLSIGKSRTLKRGKALAVSGNLTRLDSVGYDGFGSARATLQSHLLGRAWKNVATRSADEYSRGALVAVSVRPKRTTFYRWLFTEKRDSKAAHSPVMKVTVRR